MRKLALCMLLACFSSVWMLAQYNSNDKGKADTRSETGCLQKTSHANQYLLVANDGSSWTLQSDSVSLGDHVGHTVTVTGAVANTTAHNMKEDTKDMAHDTGMKKDNAEHGKLKVTDLKMVSDSCSK